MKVQLTERECQLLLDLVTNRCSQLLLEISHTDSPTYRHGLEHMHESFTAIERTLTETCASGATACC